MGSHQPIRKVVTPEIPDKLYFRIGDVARICEVPAYVLRFWETEFPQLKPNKGGTGQRLYRKRDVEMALRIKSLLYDQGYTIPGARQVFKGEGKAKESALGDPAEPAEAKPRAAAGQAATPHQATADAHRDALQCARLQVLRDEMSDLLRTLSTPVGSGASPVASGKPRLHALRPRLVLEMGSNGTKSSSLRAVSQPDDANRERQAELFATSPRAVEPAPAEPESSTSFNIE